MITAVVLSKNEEKNIKLCLESLKWANEIIVIDDYSTDSTTDIAKKYTSKIYQNKLAQDFSSQRNFALSKVNTEWVLFIDADERVSEGLKNEIIGIMNFPNSFDAYKIKRIDNMWGKYINHGEQGNTYILRLFKKELGTFYGKIHEVARVNGRVGKLRNHMVHYPHQSIANFLLELNTYSSIRAKELFDKGVKSSGFLIIFYTVSKFIKNYLIMLGFLDGIRGLILSIMMSFHTFLSRGKLYLLWKKN